MVILIIVLISGTITWQEETKGWRADFWLTVQKMESIIVRKALQQLTDMVGELAHMWVDQEAKTNADSA